MAEGILAGLNAAQNEAVTSEASVLQVLAPPGSGKTKTLTARVAYLLAHKQLKPWNLIICTFTVKAANEMKERIRSFIGDECAKQLKLGTFHSISLRYLKQYGQHIGLDKDFGIADTADSKAIVKRIIKQNDFTVDANQARSRISGQKAKGIDSEQFASSSKKVEQQEFAQVYRDYDAALKASNLLDYDDLLLRCCFLLRTHPQCVSNVEALLIDEFQDTNNIQYELMALFAQHRNAITIVGDPDQSIYGFRAAEIKNLGRMKQQWPDTLTINLMENYRSSGALLSAAQNIIEQDGSRPEKKLQATHSYGLRPVLRKLPSAAAEAHWLVSEVKRMQALTGNLLQPNDFAVLLRSATLSRVIETALGKEGVPYRMIGGVRFYDRVEVKLLVDYLRVANAPDNSEAVERIINNPPRRVGEGTVKSLHEEARAKAVSLWSLVLDIAQGNVKPSTKVTTATQKGLEIFVDIILTVRRKVTGADGDGTALLDILTLVLKKLSYQDWLKSKYPDDFDARWTNVEELILQATEVSDPEKLRSMLEDTALHPIDGIEQRTLSTAEDALSIFLGNIALTASTEQKAEQEGEKLQQLTISTIHGAKGLEWPVVFIPACYDGSIPHSRADDHDEERRLLYVGMTRAQALLYLSSPLKGSQREDTCMSTFLAQPGVSTFFDEHGPLSTVIGNAKDLAVVLRRERPPDTILQETRQALERDEDNYWPLNGEEPSEERAKWNHGKDGDASSGPGDSVPLPGFSSAAVTMHQQQAFLTASSTMKPGFVSVSAQYDELMEQSRLQKMDKRAEQSKPTLDEKPKGRKRQIEGQGSIASFFTKRQQVEKEPSVENSTPSAQQNSGPSRLRPGAGGQPLQEIRNPSYPPSDERPAPSLSLPKRKLQTAPLLKQPSTRVMEASTVTNDYVFLSSSPQKPEDEVRTSDTAPTSDAVGGEDVGVAQARPASTFHTTSVQQAQTVPPQRKTLGVRRSMQGWSARGGRT